MTPEELATEHEKRIDYETALCVNEEIMETQKNKVQAQMDEVRLATELNRLDYQLVRFFQTCLEAEYRVKEIRYYDDRPFSMVLRATNHVIDHHGSLLGRWESLSSRGEGKLRWRKKELHEAIMNKVK